MDDKNRVVILLADDDPDDQELTKDALHESKISNPLYIVNDGVELMDFLYRRGKFAPPADAPRPGLILLDLNMPRKDGREALQEIKADPELKQIPVVVLTTSKAEVDVLESYLSGSNSFITKPVTFEGLKDCLKVFVKYWLEIVELPTKK